jgi:signal transduction histidine kinase
VGWVTPSNQSNFKKAVIVLTAYYTIGVFVVLLIFNMMVYFLFTKSFPSNENTNKEHSIIILKENANEEEGIKEIKDNLFNILLTSDAMILVLAFIVAYILSKKTLTPLEESYKKQTRFVADAAHELRTPLAVMKAGSEVILRNKRSESEYIRFINECLEEVERLTTLSNDLLFLAQNNIKKENQMSEVALSELCKKQIEIMQAYSAAKNIKIKDSIKNNLYIFGNKDDLLRLIINLLKNSIDYNIEGGSVNFSLIKKDEKVILEIEDTGLGIKSADITHIFERFYKVDNSRTQNSSGTGLGLSIVKEIVDEHLGLIEVESTINKGTKIRVIFPCI